MKKYYFLLLLLVGVTSISLSQTTMPLPPHGTVYNGLPRGYWFTAPVAFTITGVKISPEAGTGTQYIHIMKCNTPFPIAFGSQSTNFNTLAYISNAPNNVTQPVNIQVNQGDVIGIMGTVTGNGNSYSASQITTSTIAGQTVTLSRFGHQTSIEGGPATSYWGVGPTESGQISRIEMTYTVGPCTNPPFAGNAVSSKLNVCSGENFSLSLDTATFGSGQTHQWQSSPDSLVWTNITGATSPTFSTSQTTTTYYRCQLTCTATTSSGGVKVETLSGALPGGTYSINSNLPTSGTNYASFNDFFGVINCGGIAGAITLNVAPNASGYNEQVILSTIGGTSATNTITINGNGALLTFAGGTNRGTLILDGTQHIKINKLTIEGSGTANSYAVELRNDARFIEFDSCYFKANTTATVTTVAGFVTSNSATGAVTAGLAARDLTVTNCIVEGGYYGMVINGPTTAPWSSNNLIENNEIRDFYLYGLYLRGQQNSSFLGNSINRANRSNLSTFYGIYLTSGMENVLIDGNRIHNIADLLPTNASANYPFYMTGANATAANPCIISNNAVYNINNNGTTYGVYLLSGTHLRFYHNTIKLDNSTASGTGIQRPFFISASSGVFDIRNNISFIDHSGTGAKQNIYLSSTVPTFTINNNQYVNLSSAGTNTFGFYGTTVNTFADWQTVNNGSFDQNGVLGDPIFSTTDPILPQSSAGNAAGANLFSIVANDIYGIARTTTPDIGAVEYTPLTCLQPLGFSGISTSSSITINWTNDPDADSVHIEYGPCGFNQGTGTMVNATGSTFTATGLFSETCYTFYVYTWCNGVAGNGTSIFSFSTLCGAKTIPYSENFDNTPAGTAVAVPNTPQCWTYLNTSGLTTVYGYNYTSLAPNSLPNHWRMYNGSNTTDTLALASPALIGLTAEDKRVRFWAKSNVANPTRMFVGTMTNPLQTNTITILDTFFAPQNYTEFTKVFNTATGYNGTDQYVVFMLGNTATAQSLYIDDIVFESIPSCNPPIGLTAGNITPSSATITWGTINGTCFKLEYGPTGFIQGSGNGTVIQNATTPTNITGLNPITTYDVYIADCCDTNAWAGPLTFTTGCLTQLSGTYTINKNAAASATNFESFQDFVTALNQCGVSGPVTANVVAATGPYNEQLLFTPYIGASATNKVTINGNGNTLTFASTNTNQRATLTIDEAQHFKISNLKIVGSGATNCYGVELKNDARFIEFDSCEVAANTTATVTTVAAFVMSNSPTGPTTAGLAARDITIKNSLIEGGYYGLVVNGPSAAPWSTNNLIENNEIRDFYAYGLYVRGQENSTFRKNDINRANRANLTTFYGIYLTGGMVNVKVTENEIHNIADLLPSNTSANYPFYLTTVAAGSTPLLIANNLIYNLNNNGTTYGMYILTADNLRIYHNTISLDNTASTATGAQRGLFISSSSGTFDIKNNIFDIKVGGSSMKHAVYLSSTIPSFTLNYNQYHIAPSLPNTFFGFFGATAYATFASWQAANLNIFEQNGVSGDPSFVNSIGGNLTPSSGTGNNIGANLLSLVPNDFYGIARTITPDIGAIEFTPVPNDIAAIGMAIPTLNSCGDSNSTVEVVVKNIGTMNQSNFFVGADITGAITSNLQLIYTGTLQPQQSDTVLVGTFNTAAGGSFNVTGYVALASDLNPGNDTIMATTSILDILPRIPTAALDSVCQGGFDTLFFPSNAGSQSFVWLTTTGDTLGTNDSLIVGPMGANDTTFVLRPGAASGQVGPIDNTIGTTGNYTAMNHFLLFTVHTSTTIYSVDVFATGAGLIDVLIQDAATTNTLFTNTVASTGPGLNTLVINQPITPGTYRMGSTTTNNAGGLQRNSTGAVFPYIATDASISITGTTFNATSYYYFYNWQLGGGGCPRPDGEVTIYNNGQFSGAFSATLQPPTLSNLTVNFDASATVGANTYAWIFGDGGTGTGMVTSHTYLANGTYTVQLIISGPCGTDTISQSVTITGIGIEETLLGQSLSIYPNPNAGNFRVSFMVEGVKNANINVVNPMGQVVYTYTPGNISGEFKHDIDLSRMAAGVYIVQITTDDGTISRRVTVQK